MGESEKLARFADADVAAYREYIASRRTAQEQVAIRKAIEVPLDAARAAASGLKLCDEAAPYTPASIAPDLGTARFLLAGALRGISLSIEVNARHLDDRKLADELRKEVQELLNSTA